MLFSPACNLPELSSDRLFSYQVSIIDVTFSRVFTEYLKSRLTKWPETKKKLQGDIQEAIVT